MAGKASSKDEGESVGMLVFYFSCHQYFFSFNADCRPIVNCREWICNLAHCVILIMTKAFVFYVCLRPCILSNLLSGPPSFCRSSGSKTFAGKKRKSKREHLVAFQLHHPA